MQYELTSAQNGKRVRLEVAGSDPVSVMVGNPSDSWPNGCFIEVVRVSATASVQFEPFDGSVTLNVLGGTNALQDGEYGRVSYVSPGVWDLHVYRAAPSLTLSQLVDVDDASAAADNVLIYNGSLWVPSAPPYPFKSTPIKPAPLTTITTAATSLDAGSSAHHNTHYRLTSATNITVTVRPDSFWTGTEQYWANNYAPTTPGPMPNGGNVIFMKLNTGNVNFVAGPGVTINTPDTLTISRINGKATLIKVGPNEWDLEGNIGT